MSGYIDNSFFLAICGSLLTIIFALVGVIFGYVTGNQKKISSEMKEIKDNYLIRFDEIKNDIGELAKMVVRIETTCSERRNNCN